MDDGSQPADVARGGNHFSCSLSAVLINRVRRVAGEDAVERLLREADSARTRAYLEDIGNWISIDEAIALWTAGQRITGDPLFARHVGEDAVRVLGSSSTSTVLRTLGAPEELLRQMTVAASRFSVAATLEALEVRPGYAEIRAVASPGFTRNKLHCQWTTGMLTQVTAVFGLPPARVEHESCQAEGSPDCRYRVSWDVSAEDDVDPAEQVAILQKRLDALSERLQSVFETASDLIASRGLDETLARITERAAHQVRAPRYLLAVRPTPDSELHCHQKGFDDEEARRTAARVVANGAAHPDHWLVVPVSSHRNHYGSLVAMYEAGARFFPAERQLLEVYARYAATALDTATALAEAEARQEEAVRRYNESRNLLELARRLASARSSADVAERLSESAPGVIDCDRVSVYLWDEASGELCGRAGERTTLRPDGCALLARWLEQPQSEPVVIDGARADGRALAADGAAAAVAVPITAADQFVGCFVASVHERERLAPNRELADRLSGVAAHAATALENGRLLDRITHQASHDQLTGLANRVGFSERLARATKAAPANASLALYYIDLDRFKPVNDEFGHAIGDELLRAVAERLRRCVRASDTVARLGGDEFAVLVEDIVDWPQIAQMTERLERAFAEPVVAGGKSFRITASIGRAVWPVDVSTPDALLRQADAAMYEAKRSARDAAASIARP